MNASLKYKVMFILFAVFLTSGFLLAKNILHPRGDFLSIKKVEKRWGKEKFDAAKFKNGDMKIRASMAASILKNKDLIGKTNVEIWQLLGRHDGRYFSSVIPAYVIEDHSMTGGNVWQIVFFLDKHYKVESIKVHRNTSEIFPF